VAVVLEASSLLAHERGRLGLAQPLARRQQDEFWRPAVTASDLLHGVSRASQPEVRAKRSAWVEAILGRFPPLPVELATARAHAQRWAELAATGKMRGPHDLWLAATGLAHGLTMVTANRRECARVPGRAVEVWGGPPSRVQRRRTPTRQRPGGERSFAARWSRRMAGVVLPPPLSVDVRHRRNRQRHFGYSRVAIDLSTSIWTGDCSGGGALT
jgi:tRNA(fMet)-specific endonuclease VapC